MNFTVPLEENQIMIEEINNNWNTGTLEYPFGRGINISMTVTNVFALYNHLQKQQIKIFRELKTDEYRVENIIYKDQEFLIQDPDGYLLRFTN